MTTVGYGEVHPEAVLEIVLDLALQFAGVVLWALFIVLIREELVSWLAGNKSFKVGAPARAGCAWSASMSLLERLVEDAFGR